MHSELCTSKDTSDTARAKTSDLRRRLKAVNDVDEVTLDGRLLHTHEAATWNAQSPMVEWRISGTTSVDEDADLRRRRDLCSPLYGVHWRDMAEPSSSGSATLVPSAWNQSAAALAASVGHRASDWRPCAFSCLYSSLAMHTVFYKINICITRRSFLKSIFQYTCRKGYIFYLP